MVGFRWAQCRRVRAVLWDYASERLSEGPMERVEAHLPQCASCREELAGLRRAEGLLSACRAQEEPAPRSNWSDLQQRIVAEGIAHVTPRAPSRRPAASVGLSYAARSGRAPWSMQLATSMAGGFAAVLVIALGYRVLNLSGTAATKPAVTLASRHANPSSMPDLKPNVPDAARPDDNPHGAQIMTSMFGFLSNIRVEPQTEGTASTPIAVPVSLTSVSRKREPRLERRNVQAVAKPQTHHDNSVAANSVPHFKHYAQKSGDSLPDTSQTVARAALEHVQPVGYESDDSNVYVVGSVLPVSHDDDHDY